MYQFMKNSDIREMRPTLGTVMPENGSWWFDEKVKLTRLQHHIELKLNIKFIMTNSMPANQLFIHLTMKNDDLSTIWI